MHPTHTRNGRKVARTSEITHRTASSARWARLHPGQVRYGCR